MGDVPEIGGAPVVTLVASDVPAQGPAFLEAHILPGRGMMLLQAKLRLGSGEVIDALFAPPLDVAASEMGGGEDDFVGNRSFAIGGAFLIPYANRIRGRSVDGAREIEAQVDGRTVRLPRNWGGKAEGAEQYAMHGLLLDTSIPFEQPAPDQVIGRLNAGDFGGRWPSRTELVFTWRLTGGAIETTVEAANVGDEPLPIGIGWHPYFNVPSGDRRQVRLRLPAAKRTEVNDYDEVLPTGRLLDTQGTPYDFNGTEGRALGDLYLDDCFTQLAREGGEALVEIIDPAADLRLRVTSSSPEVKAIQVYAPPEKNFVVVEPQFNLADPYSSAYGEGVDTGMARLAPGQRTVYRARVDALALGT
jgi:galactose mutarotase-like enzyme